MQPTAIRTLTVTLSSHLASSKSRIDTLAFLSIGMVNARQSGSRFKPPFAPVSGSCSGVVE